MSISIDEWLELPSNGFKTKTDELDCMFAESGADREMDFDREVEYEKAYNEYLSMD